MYYVYNNYVYSIVQIWLCGETYLACSIYIHRLQIVLLFPLLENMKISSRYTKDNL